MREGKWRASLSWEREEPSFDVLTTCYALPSYLRLCLCCITLLTRSSVDCTREKTHRKKWYLNTLCVSHSVYYQCSLRCIFSERKSTRQDKKTTTCAWKAFFRTSLLTKDDFTLCEFCQCKNRFKESNRLGPLPIQLDHVFMYILTHIFKDTFLS